MKKYYSIPVLALILLLSSNGIQAQTKLNQVELMKQQIGVWKCLSNKDTIVFWEGKPYGKGLDCNFHLVVNGKTAREGRELWGYDKSIDKFICASSEKEKDMELLVVWFTSKNVYEYIRYHDVSHPGKASWKIVGVLTSPDVVIETTTVNNKTTLVQTYTKVK